jgi:lysozyme
MTNEDIQTMIKKHEGFKTTIYLDTEGVPTAGWGHAFLVNSVVPEDVCERFFERDFAEATRNFNSFCALNDIQVDSVRKAVLIDMAFNLGLPKLLKFKKMIAALQVADYDEAARQMEDSKWYGQVGSRGRELVRMMKTGRSK